jgi:hypothetical protein
MYISGMVPYSDLEDWGPQGSVCIVNGNAPICSIVTSSSVILLKLASYLPWLQLGVFTDR